MTVKKLLTDKEIELISLLMQDCQSTGQQHREFPQRVYRKTVIGDYGESEIVVPRDHNGEFETLSWI